MKKTLLIIPAILLLFIVTSCEKDLSLYDDPTCRLNFYYDISSRADFKSAMARSSYSFVYAKGNVETDTLWFKVQTMGMLSDHDRQITLAQQDTTAAMAVPGKHYVAFDDPSMAAYYKIPANKATTFIPVVLLRDASLKDTAVVLKFGFKDNDEFIGGYPEYQTRTITFTDRMAEPANWTRAYPYYGTYTISMTDLFGDYGVVKHQFLIDHTGKAWDDEFITTFMTGDSNYRQYICDKMQMELDALNAERAASGLNPLSEADGTVVAFS